MRRVTDLSQYLPIMIFLVFALGLSSLFVFLPMGVARLTGTHQPSEAKLAEYECGFPAFEDSRSQLDVLFCSSSLIWKPPSSSPGQLAWVIPVGLDGER